jgi:hypothetical protein
MDSSSVLADQFVPYALEAVNFIRPNTLWAAVDLPVLDTELAAIFFQSVPAPLCPCSCGKDGNNDSSLKTPAATSTATVASKVPVSPNLPPHHHIWSFPLRILDPELNFAVERRVEKLHGTSKHESLTDEQAGDLVLPAVEDIKDPVTYRETFEAILTAERKEVLVLYERYSQYDKPIATHIDNDDSSSRVQMCIPGIADAHPPLEAGDFLLLRPVKKLSFPVTKNDLARDARETKARKNRRSRPICHQWSLPINVLEMQCRVVNIVRDRMPTILGAVQGTWVPFLQAETLDQCHPNGNYNLRVIPNTKMIQRCLTALDWLATVPSDMVMLMLFPDQAPKLLSLIVKDDDDDDDDANSKTGASPPWTADDLNDKQSAFCQLVLARTRSPAFDQVRGPMVLTGPAGTGKTKVLLASIRLVLQEKKLTTFIGTGSVNADSFHNQHRILVCTPSHTACDVVCRRLSKFLNRTQLFRLYDADRPIATVPVEILAFCRQSGQNGSFSMPPAAELLAFQVIVCTCSDAHLLYMAGLTNQQLRCRRRCFQQSLDKLCHNQNLSTVVQGVDEPHFTHLFIDEAAQATEPETMIPFSVVVDPCIGTRKVEIVLSGDPRQLQPAVYSATAAAAGLNRSLMERLLQRPVRCLGDGNENMLGPNLVRIEDWLQYSFERDGQEQLSVFLTTNYRGHASFLMLPSALFYGDKLLCAHTEEGHDDVPAHWCEQLRGVENLSEPASASISITCTANNKSLPEELELRKQHAWPMHFRGVVGKDASVTIESFSGGHSWSNLKEAEAVTKIVRTLTKQGVSSQSIAVMAPFRGQVVLIRKLLRLEGLGAVGVGTVEDYQAVERDVIVLSMTRSTQAFVASDMERRMGLLGQPKRSNVALTRAEHLLIVVGDPNTMAKDFVWSQFLWFCLRNGLWYGETGATESSFHWGASHRLSRSRPRFETKEPLPGEDGAEQVVTVSTLERLLRE